MIRYLCLVLLLISCGVADSGGTYRSSIYKNKTDKWLDNVQTHFETNYGYKPKRDLKDGVAFFFWQSQQDMHKVCRLSQDVAGCISSYWVFHIYDHPDPFIRCRAVLHEAGHMIIAQLSYWETQQIDWQYDHQHPYFSTFVFDPKNCE